MATLHLPPCPAAAERQASEGGSERRWKWLQRVEDVVRKVAGGGEARMWLCAALGSLDLPPSVQRAAFLGLVSADGDEGCSVRERVVRMVCENKPSWAARVIARDDRLLKRFFDGDSKRILQWFGKFSTGGETDHQWGARALARYTFVHRESCWQELDWKGRHGQAPATVASKPHYFLELDVLHTVDNFLDHVPSFWRSEELWESMRDGDFLSLDVDFFVRELVEKMMIDDCPKTWCLVEDYLAEESVSKLANCVLHLLSENSLLNFINDLVVQLPKASPERRSRRKEVNWLQEVILSGDKCKSLSDAVVCNACAKHRRQLLNIIRCEDYEDDAAALKVLLSEAETDQMVVWGIRREGLQLNRWIGVKWLAVEAWVLYVRLTEMNNEISYPVLFKENGISFDEPPVTPRKRKKKRSKKRKKHRLSDDSGSSSSGEAEDYGLENKGWRLCTDNFSFLWRKEDLPEYLSGFAFEEWIKWSVSQW